MSICLPGMMLTNLFAELNRESNPARHTGEDNSDEIFGRLRDSELEIIAELGRTQILLSDVYHLSVGDVIDLNHRKDMPVVLKVGGHRWFDGRMGIYNKNMAVKIIETYHEEQRRGV